MWHIRRGEVLTRRWSSRFYIGGDVGGAVAVRAPGFGDVFDAPSSTSADTHGYRDDDWPKSQVESSSRPVLRGGRVFQWTPGSSERQHRYWSCAPARRSGRTSDVGAAFDAGAAASFCSGASVNRCLYF